MSKVTFLAKNYIFDKTFLVNLIEYLRQNSRSRGYTSILDTKLCQL